MRINKERLPKQGLNYKQRGRRQSPSIGREQVGELRKQQETLLFLEEKVI